MEEKQYKEDIINAQNGNKESMEKLLNENQGLIWSIVKRFQGRGYETEDLYQIGSMGFIKSIKRFDTNFEVKLSTYAVPYILGEIKRFIRDDGLIKVSRSVKELAIKIKEIQREYLEKKGEEITIEQIAKELKISKEEIAVAMDSFTPVESIYTSVSKEGDGELTILDKLSNRMDEENHMIEQLSIRQVIDNLENQERQLILLRYYRGKTQSQVAKILGITQVQVSRLERKVLSSLKGKLAV